MRVRSFRPARWAAAAAAIVGALLVAGPLGARTGALPGGNLVKNPGAEDSAGAATDTVVPIAGWVTTGPMTAWTYGALGDRPDHTFATSINGGTNFFSGGPGGIAGTPTASQKIDVAGAAAEIDLGDVAATLSAYIGGYTVSGDLPQIDASFHDAAGARLGGIRIGPVNREQRKRMTTLLKRSATATLPKLTRRIDVAISVTVDNNGKNHAYVDNISLTLAKSAGRLRRQPPGSRSACARKDDPRQGSAGERLRRDLRVFLVNGRAVAIDKKAPFSARIGSAGLPAQLKVAARVKAGGKTRDAHEGDAAAADRPEHKSPRTDRRRRATE